MTVDTSIELCNVYQSIFQNLPDSSIIVNLQDNYKIIKVNHAFHSQFMPTERALHLSFPLDLLNHDERSIFLSAIEIMKADHRSTAIISPIKTLTLEGKEMFPVYRHCEWNYVVLDENLALITGRIISSSSSSSSFSSSQQQTPIKLSDRESELIDFFQEAPISLHWLSSTGHVIWANNTELKSLGYAASEYIGHHIIEFCPEEGEALSEVFAQLSAGETIRNVPFKFRTKSGEAKYLTVDSNVSFHSDGTFKHTRCFIRDDTDRRVKEAIREANIKQMKLSTAAKDRFIRRVFHEIRTPMHVVSTCLTSGTVTSLTPGEMAELSNQTEVCLGLIEDLALATMFESGNLLKLCPVPLNIRNILDTAVNQVKVISIINFFRYPQSITIQVDQNIADEVILDKCITRALFNLIKNCCQTCGSKGYITVHTFSTNVDTNDSSTDSNGSNNTNPRELHCKIVASVERELDAVEVHKSFYKYYNSDMNESELLLTVTTDDNNNNDNNNDGQPQQLPQQEQTGAFKDLTESYIGSNVSLGWYVAYNVIQNLGGVLNCDVQPHEVQFSFSVPIEPSELSLKLPLPVVAEEISNKITPVTNVEDVQSEITVTGSSLASLHVILDNPKDIKDGLEYKIPLKKCKRLKRVLIVDDSPICQKVMVKSLSANDFETDLASNGQEACDMLAYEPCLYDAVLMDLRMPVMDGITATRICKQKEHLRNIPIIIVTAEHGNDIREAANEARASYFLNKPAKAQELKDVLNRFLNM